MAKLKFFTFLTFAITAFIIFPTVFTIKQPKNLQILIGTENGPIIGQQEFTLFDEKPFYAFRGIPYAKPPIGNLRFQPPQPVTPWNETLLTLDYGNMCPQSQSAGGNENCLFVNVYTPNVSSLANLPVTIGIHGGGFTEGSGNVIGPDFIFNEADCVMVTINYRLGALGFLSLNTTEYPGNMGLKDQLLAIKWTKENIHHFGGDSNRITLYGLSAGSSSAHLHVLSTSSRYLFQRAILSSGTALNSMAIGNLSQHIPILHSFASSNGQNIQNNDELIEYLRTVDAQQLIDGTHFDFMPNERIGLDLVWAPVVEPIGSVDIFLSQTPTEIMKNNFPINISILFGYCSAESYFFVDPHMRDPERFLVPLNQNFDIQLPLYSVNQHFTVNSQENSHIADEIREFYFGSNSGQINGISILEFTELSSDLLFHYAIDRSVKLHAIGVENSPTNANTYYYRLSVVASLNIIRMLTFAPPLGLPGATHGDDVFYAFGNVNYLRPLYEIFQPDSLERQTIREFSQMFANFIVNGNPNFKPARPNEQNFMDFTNNGFIEGIDPQRNISQFWENLFDRHNMW